jgi:hypothetical protein
MPSFAIESGAFEDDALREEAEDFQVPDIAKPDLKLLEDERAAAKAPSAEFSETQRDTIRDKLKTESTSETLENALDRFEAVNNEALKTELNELFDAINNRFNLDHEKTRGEKSAEAVKAWLSKIGEREIGFTLRNEVPPKKHSIRLGNLTTFLSGVAVGMAQSTVAKKILISATGIKGAAAAAIVGGTIGAIRGGMSANKSAEKTFYSAEGWKQEVDKIEDPIEKLTMIESLLNNPEYAKYFKDKPEGAIELLGEYQKIALAVDDEALTRLLKNPNNADAMARWRALSEMKLYKDRKEDEKRAMIIKGVGRGAIRGAAWGLAGYGAFKLLGWMFHGLAAHAQGGTAGAGSEGIPQDKPNLEWRHDVSEHGRLILDPNQGRFLASPDQTSIYSVEAQVTPEHIANSITHDILNSGDGTGSHAKFEMDPTQESAFKDFLTDYIKSHPHAIGDHVRVPAEELNKALDFAQVKITPDTILDHSGAKYEFPSSASQAAPPAPDSTPPAGPGTPAAPPPPPAGTTAPAPVAPPAPATPGSIPNMTQAQLEAAAKHGEHVLAVDRLKDNIELGAELVAGFGGLGFLTAYLVERLKERKNPAYQNKLEAAGQKAGEFLADKLKKENKPKHSERLEAATDRVMFLLGQPSYSYTKLGIILEDLDAIDEVYAEQKENQTRKRFQELIDEVATAAQREAGNFKLSKEGRKVLRKHGLDLNSDFEVTGWAQEDDSLFINIKDDRGNTAGLRFKWFGELIEPSTAMPKMEFGGSAPAAPAAAHPSMLDEIFGPGDGLPDDDFGLTPTEQAEEKEKNQKAFDQALAEFDGYVKQEGNPAEIAKNFQDLVIIVSLKNKPERISHFTASKDYSGTFIHREIGLQYANYGWSPGGTYNLDNLKNYTPAIDEEFTIKVNPAPAPAAPTDDSGEPRSPLEDLFGPGDYPGVPAAAPTAPAAPAPQPPAAAAADAPGPSARSNTPLEDLFGESQPAAVDTTEAEQDKQDQEQARAEREKYINKLIERATPEQRPTIQEAIDQATGEGREVLLVDSNWNHPSLTSLFDIPQPKGDTDQPIGFADVVMGNTTFDETIQDTQIPGLRIVTIGNTLKPHKPDPDNEQPDEFEPHEQLVRILSRATDVADVVLYTSPPTLLDSAEQSQNSFERALAEFDGYEAYSDFADQSPTLDDMAKEYEDFVLLTTDNNGKTIAAKQYIVLQKNPYKFLEKTIDSTTHIYAVSYQDWITQLPGVICKVNPASKINPEPSAPPAPKPPEPIPQSGKTMMEQLDANYLDRVSIPISPDSLLQYIRTIPLPYGASFENLNLQITGARSGELTGKIMATGGSVELALRFGNDPGQPLRITESDVKGSNFVINRLVGPFKKEFNKLHGFLTSRLNNDLSNNRIVTLGVGENNKFEVQLEPKKS